MSGHEHGPVTPLEQRCVEPGRWLIEGWEVRRHGSARRPSIWIAERDGERFSRTNLAAVREEIRSRLDA